MVRRFSLIIALVLIIGVSTAAALSRSDDAADNQAITATVAATPSISSRDDSKIQADAVDVIPDSVDAAVMPAAADSTQPQSAGDLIDGLRLDDIRWGDHETYYRIVFDLSTTSGEPVTQAPHADAMMSPGANEIEVTLGGIRGISEQPNVIEQKLDIGGTTVVSIERVPSMDDQALIYRIQLVSASTYTLDSLGDPGRVIIDVYK